MCERLLAISDTHGSSETLAQTLRWAKALKPAAAVFLGDGISDVEKASAKAGFSGRWYKVCGNNDFGFGYKEAAVFDFGGHRFFICHGHRYDLYDGNEVLVAAARNNGAAVALFGHLHVPSVDFVSGVMLVNPGSLGSPRSSVGATFAIIECNPGEPPKPVFWGIGRGGNVSRVSAGKAFRETADYSSGAKYPAASLPERSTR
jgi:putative phosphoesterase